MARYVVGRNDVIWLELRANPKLQWREFSVKSRSVCRDPVRTPIEIHEHRRIAAGGDNPVGDRTFLELMAFQQFGPLGARDAVFSIEDVWGAAIGIAYGASIRQSLDLISSLPAVVAIADTAHDRPAERFELDAAARACCGHDG